MQIVPLRFLSYRYKKKRSVAFKIRQNWFSALPRTPLGSSRRFPRPLVGWRGDTPPHTKPHSAPTHLGARHASPSECEPDLRLCTEDRQMRCAAADHSRHEQRRQYSSVSRYALLLCIAQIGNLIADCRHHYPSLLCLALMQERISRASKVLTGK